MVNIEDIRFPGTCLICKGVIFEVIKKYPDSHPFARKPWKIGGPLPNAIRLNTITASGAVMHISVCEKCITSHETIELLCKAWDRIKKSYAVELDDDYRKILGHRKILSQAEKEHEMVFLSVQFPVGISSIERWVEIWPKNVV